MRTKRTSRWLRIAIVTTWAMLAWVSGSSSDARAATVRIVTAGPALTEIVYALGMGEMLVGVDLSSQFPPATKALPRVGYHRQLAAEGILALRPTLVLVTEESGPPVALEHLRQSGVEVVVVAAEKSVVVTVSKIRQVAKVIGRVDAGEECVETLRRALKRSGERIEAQGKKPRVLFVYATGSGAMMVSGQDTAASNMIALAGGTNVVTAYTGYRPLTAEAMIAAAPDVIVLPTRALAMRGGVAGVLSAPGVALTPAGHSKTIVGIDDVLVLGFGPRLPQAIDTLREAMQGR